MVSAVVAGATNGVLDGATAARALSAGDATIGKDDTEGGAVALVVATGVIVVTAAVTGIIVVGLAGAKACEKINYSST